MELFKIVLLLAPLLCLSLVVTQHVEFSRRIGANRTSAFFLSFFVLLYIPSLIAGAAGLYSATVVYTLSLIISFALINYYRILLSRFPCPGINSNFSINTESLIVFLVGLILMAPVVNIIYQLPFEIWKDDIWLPWDSVSYHLPALVEYVQEQSFWSQKGPYQSYSFAYEAIVNFGSLLFPSHVGFIIGNVLSILFFCVAVYYLVEVLIENTNFLQKISHAAVTVLTIGIWCLIFKNKFLGIGKNDIFQTACILMAFALLIDLYVTVSRNGTKKAYLLLSSCCAAGLALGTKPTSLAYIPYFSIVVLAGYWDARKNLTANLMSRPVVKNVIIFLAGVYFIGGFFLTRNLIVYGTINPMPSASDLSLIANLSNSALYIPKLGAIVFVCGIISIFFWIIPYVLSNSTKSKKIIVLMALFHVCAMVTFSITPHAIFHHTTQWTNWKLRLGLPFFTCMVLVCSLLASIFFERIAHRKKMIQAVLIVVVCLVFSLLTLKLNVEYLPGLPHYEEIRGNKPTKAYHWVQKQQKPLRIYSSGLRPYGLYGVKWQNRVFYDLHSTPLTSLSRGKVRIFSVLNHFNPDLIIISIDPHPYSNGDLPVTVKWMESRTDCFSLEYSDAAVKIFRVKQGAASILDKEGIEKKDKLRMYG